MHFLCGDTIRIMSVFAEVWFARKQAEEFRKLCAPDKRNNYYPHITLVRPFDIVGDNEFQVMKAVEVYCLGRSQILFSLEGMGNFGQINYIPVVDSHELLEFSDGLELAVAPFVKFVPKLADQKTLHLTVEAEGKMAPYPKKNFLMRFLTLIKNKRIWSSFDFELQRMLAREESLELIKD